MRLRIAVVGPGVRTIPPKNYGGVEKYLGEFVRALREAGHEVVLINHAKAGREQAFGRSWTPLNDLQALRNGVQAVLESDRSEFDAIHAFTWHSAVQLAGVGRSYFYTLNFAAWGSFVRRPEGGGLIQRIERQAILHASAAIGATEPLCKSMHDIAPRQQNIICIPHGVDTSRFSPRSAVGDGRIALGIGVIDPRKRWHLAARALRGTGIRMRIAGPVSHAAYAASIQDMGSVDLIGEVPEEELLAEVERCGFLIHPSASETFGLAVAESLSGGRPVIGCSSVSPLIARGLTGFVVEDDDRSEAEISDVIRDLSVLLSANNELRGRMGQAARAEAIRRFAWPKIVDTHVALYARLGQATRSGG